MRSWYDGTADDSDDVAQRRRASQNNGNVARRGRRRAAESVAENSNSQQRVRRRAAASANAFIEPRFVENMPVINRAVENIINPIIDNLPVADNVNRNEPENQLVQNQVLDDLDVPNLSLIHI